MITSKELRPALFEVSGNLIGIKLFNDKKTADTIINQIKEDLTSIKSINKITLSVKLEDFNDYRFENGCVIFDLQMLVRFNTRYNEKAIKLIKKYITTTYVAPLPE
ncbi:hypothetical protein BA195_10120 [Tenacibaculum soleae]|uniref:Uncharacterized protein n=1 Tax=Tenacibaculum soleae TaxID=447689 RepID=A0A1B9XYB7_9FLAO|nr:hypothetical protein [Tenacibaculum soleae]OCK42522.1 hypothetical protein BA195_10120 [Tenacibaculum soleae]